MASGSRAIAVAGRQRRTVAIVACGNLFRDGSGDSGQTAVSNSNFVFELPSETHVSKSLSDGERGQIDTNRCDLAPLALRRECGECEVGRSLGGITRARGTRDSGSQTKSSPCRVRAAFLSPGLSTCSSVAAKQSADEPKFESCVRPPWL